MGYYSEVGFALTSKGRACLTNKLSCPELPDKIRRETSAFLENANIHKLDKASGAEIWVWRNVKWYINDPEYFPEVCFMEELISELEEEDFIFVRIGEEYSDNEWLGLFDENPFGLTLTREIVLDAA